MNLQEELKKEAMALSNLGVGYDEIEILFEIKIKERLIEKNL
ncbi:MAG: hypothetical protein AABX28_01435 [Nanoarchaeota archaeon]